MQSVPEPVLRSVAHLANGWQRSPRAIVQRPECVAYSFRNAPLSGIGPGRYVNPALFALTRDDPEIQVRLLSVQSRRRSLTAPLPSLRKRSHIFELEIPASAVHHILVFL